MGEGASEGATPGVTVHADPTCIAGRFRVHGLLGRGGNASAYRVEDLVTGRALALKLLAVLPDDPRATRATEYFEREYHSLMHLAHPRVVEAYDYGVADGRPYYTLELLDGGDLVELAPLPWQQVCRIAYEVCSALSLLHSRRLLHLDISPRNIRRAADGKAKLIDFGLLSPMGPPSIVAGTPAYVAPEVIHRTTLDGRTDLFSLGATLYHVLTGRAAFPARHFAQLHDFWRSPPAAPSKLVPEIPKPVDDLVLALLRIDMTSRPKSTAEVMDRLRPLLDAPPDEELSAARAYLTTPQLVGREDVIISFRKQMLRTLRGRGGGFLIAGAPGVGRSRMLDAFALEAKLVGATALRASASDAAAGPFGVASALAADLNTAHPASALRALREDSAVYSVLFRELPGDSADSPSRAELRELASPDLDRSAVQCALRGFFLLAASEHTLALAVDDLGQIDEPSAALLATLSWEAASHRLVYAISTDDAALNDLSAALATLSTHAALAPIGPITAEEMDRLLVSVFGDVPNLHLLGRCLYDVCGGRPRDCMALAQHLVDIGAIRYAGGVWTLPGELAADVLPARMEEALEQRIAALTPLASRLGLLFVLNRLEFLSRAQLMRLEHVAPAAIDGALAALISGQLLKGGPAGYALCHSSLAGLLTSKATDEERADAHRDLARICELSGDSPVAVAHHLLHAGRVEAGLDGMLALSQDAVSRVREIDRAELQLGTDRTAETYMLLLEEAQRRGRPVAELQTWRAMLAGMSARGGDVRYYYALHRAWLEQLQRDSGYDDWHLLDALGDPGQRLKQALAEAGNRYERTPLAQRGMPPGGLYERLMDEGRQAGLEVANTLGLTAFGSEASASLTRVSNAMAGCSSPTQRSQRALELLCSDVHPTRGHLFLLTENGLWLAASNTGSGAPEGLRNFARAYLDVELLTGQVTLTEAELTVALEANAARGRWLDEDGTRYAAVLLRAQVSAEWRIVGIAMLSEEDPELSQSLQPVAAALAGNLVASGDFVGALAA